MRNSSMPMIKLKKFSLSHIDDLRVLLDNYDYGLFSRYPQISKSEQIAYCLNDFKDKLSKKKYGLLMAYKANRPVGCIGLQYLPWESVNYRLKMGQVDIVIDSRLKNRKEISDKLLKAILKETKKQKFNHLVCKLYPEEIDIVNLLEEKNFYLTACTATYCLDLKLKKRFVGKYKHRIRPYKENDKAILEKLSFSAYGNKESYLDRYHADGNLPQCLSNLLYRKWFKNCVKGERADVVFVAECAKKPVGYIACRLNTSANRSFKLKFGHIELNAVMPECRRRRIYAELVDCALNWFKNKKVGIVTITTQLNASGIHRTWQNLGAKVCANNFVLHKYTNKR